MCAPADGDSVAVIGDNRKLLLFPLSELPEMPRGKGVRLQRYKDGGLADVKTFTKKDGLTYIDSARRSFNLTATDLSDWWGERAQAGRLPPKGFPKSGEVRRRSSEATVSGFVTAADPASDRAHPALGGEVLLRLEAVLVAHLARALDPIAEIDERDALRCARTRHDRGSCRCRGSAAAGSGS